MTGSCSPLEGNGRPPRRPTQTGPARVRFFFCGRALIQRHRCNVCHLPDFRGIENVPHLAGQREDYPLKSLRNYKDNSRRGYDAQMADVVEPVTDAAFVDLAHFLARKK
jgi:cytochrome c553